MPLQKNVQCLDMFTSAMVLKACDEWFLMSNSLSVERQCNKRNKNTTTLEQKSQVSNDDDKVYLTGDSLRFQGSVQSVIGYTEEERKYVTAKFWRRGERNMSKV